MSEDNNTEIQAVDLKELFQSMNDSGGGDEEYTPSTTIELTHEIVEEVD